MTNHQDKGPMLDAIPVSLEHRLTWPLTVVVTGAGSGIGRAQALAFLEAGHRVMMVDQISADTEDFSQWKRRYGDRLSYLEGDVSLPKTGQRLKASLDQAGWQVNVLCNTAGILDDFKPLDQTSLTLWDQIFAVNIRGMMLMTQALLPTLLTQPAARIINMASIASLTAGGGGIAYTSAKHAVAGFTKQLAYDYAKTGLRINALAPGAIQTAMTRQDFEQAGGEMAHWVAQQVPLGRWAQPEEVASLTLYLASDAADYLQGTILPLDGGWLIR